jgi:hypothetical protein
MMSDSQVSAAIDRARPHHGAGGEALMRVCQEYFELGDLITVAYADFTQALTLCLRSLDKLAGPLR